MILALGGFARGAGRVLFLVGQYSGGILALRLIVARVVRPLLALASGLRIVLLLVREMRRAALLVLGGLSDGLWLIGLVVVLIARRGARTLLTLQRGLRWRRCLSVVVVVRSRGHGLLVGGFHGRALRFVERPRLLVAI